MAKVYITSGTSWAGVATDGSDITVECIGGGGGGDSTVKGSPYPSGGGGGGGEYAKKVVAYTSESSISGIQIGQGGGASANGTETHWNTNVVIAKGGSGSTSTTVASKILNIGFQYNTANSLNKWQCIAVAQEA